MLAPTQSQLVTAGSAQISTITDAPVGIQDQLSWRMINDADGTVVIDESSSGIVEVDDGHDPGLRRYDRAYTAPMVAGRYLAIWRYFLQEEAQTVIVAGGGNTAFATVDDVSARLARALTSQETSTTVPYLLNQAAGLIADAAGYDEGWAESLSPIPSRLRYLSVELVCRALPNPSQYSSLRQQVGSYSIQVAQAAPGMGLSDAEVLMVCRTVHGRTTDSVHVDSGFIRIQDEYWLRKQEIRVNSVAGSGSQETIL